MTCDHLEGEQGRVLIDGVDNLRSEGLNKEALRPKEAVEEVPACAYLPLRGQGSNDDP